MSSLAGPFHGDALEFVQLEVQLHRFWKPSWIEREKKRIRTAWFDYRHAHPALRSHFFMHAHTLAYRRAYKRFYDAQTNTTGMYPTKRRSLYACANGYIISAINLMHTVDELGLPYDVFFDAAYEHMMQQREFATVWNKAKGLRGMKLPPITVMRDGGVLIAAQTRFDRLNRTKLRLAQHSSYWAESWAGLDHQRDYVAYLVHHARKRGTDLPYALAALVYDKGVLHEREVLRHFGREMVRSIRFLRD